MRERLARLWLERGRPWLLRNRSIGLFALVVLLLAAFQFAPVSRPGAPDRYVTVDGQTNFYDLGTTLEKKRMIRNRFAFGLLGRLCGASNRVQPGYYALSPGMNSFQVLDWLIEGRGRQGKLTVPEGYSAARIAHLLTSRHIGNTERFLFLVEHPQRFALKHPWLKDLPPGSSLEGYLFPDTYGFAGNRISEEWLIDQMLTRFKAVLLNAYDREAHPKLGLHDTLTLASIVELEAVRPSERPLIAGVFYHRLQIGMRLGSDPTVEYVLGHHEGARGLSLRDVRVDSPYNTYLHTGLPPGPIGNPGLASFEATLHPAQTAALFFVARGDGTHAFTTTYQDHLAMIRRYRP